MARRKGNQSRGSSKGSSDSIPRAGRTNRISSKNKTNSLNCIGEICWDDNGKLTIKFDKAECSPEFAKKLTGSILSGEPAHFTGLRPKKTMGDLAKSF